MYVYAATGQPVDRSPICPSGPPPTSCNKTDALFDYALHSNNFGYVRSP